MSILSPLTPVKRFFQGYKMQDGEEGAIPEMSTKDNFYSVMEKIYHFLLGLFNSLFLLKRLLLIPDHGSLTRNSIKFSLPSPLTSLSVPNAPGALDFTAFIWYIILKVNEAWDPKRRLHIFSGLPSPVYLRSPQ
jgi:hypothetical protein